MRVLVARATGTLGQCVLKKLRLNENVSSVYGLTRSEKHISGISNLCDKIFIGDIRDRERVLEITKDVDLIFAFAALKHVDLMEYNIDECIKTNIHGTQNIAEAQKINKVKKVVFTSTDKAVYPINVYGHSKAIGEKIILSSSCNNVVARYGNVFGSNGSIFSRLPSLLALKNEIHITCGEMTRFWISVNDAAKFVTNLGLDLSASGVNIPQMKSSNVLDMMLLAANLLGRASPIIKTIGVRSGEKIHEDLSPDLNSNTCEKYTNSELISLIKSEIGFNKGT